MTSPAARTLEQRRRDTLHRLEHDIDLWVATADPATGSPWMVPLSFHWDRGAILIATPASSSTGRNLVASGQVRLGLGDTRDVVLIDGVVERSFSPAEIDGALGDAFAARAGFDPRRSSGSMRFFAVRPRRIHAWREENELAGRLLMKDGEWLDATVTARGRRATR
jgi:hypothetical protein